MGNPITNVVVNATDNEAIKSIVVTGLPDGVSYNEATKTISGTPTTVGVYPVDVTVTDTAGNVSVEPFTITVTEAPDTTKPVIDPIADQTKLEGVAIDKVTVVVDDPTATIAVTGLPTGVTYNETTKEISGTPDPITWGATEETKSYTVTVTATDPSNNVATEEFVITVQRDTDGDGIPDVTDTDDDGDGIPDVDDKDPKVADTTKPSVDAIADQSIVLGNPITNVVVNATDNEAIKSIVVTGLPDGVSYNEATKTISGTPTTVGVYPVDVTVTDTAGNVSVEPFTITVKEVPVLAESATPNINTPKDGDTTVAGTGIAGSVINVKFPDGTSKSTTVNPDGTWSVTSPVLKAGEVVTATQTESGKAPSPEAKATVTAAPLPAESAAPTITTPKDGDTTVTGTGIAGSNIVVSLPDGSTKETTVKPDGTGA